VEILNQILIMAFSPNAILLLIVTWIVASACRYRLHALYQPAQFVVCATSAKLIPQASNIKVNTHNEE